jgi:predicted NACHT family NTPase
MESLLEPVANFFRTNPAFGAIAAAVAGGLVTIIGTKLLPFLGGRARSATAWVLGRLSGRYEFRQFERQYLDWLITSLQDLRLAGVVISEDAAKRPRLEQVFVSVHLASSAPLGASREEIEFLTERILETQAGVADIPDLARGLRARLASLDQAALAELRAAVDRPRPEREALFRAVLDASASSRSSAEPADAPDQLRKMLGEHDRIAILGGPGSGKTSLLQYIGLAYARDRPGDKRLRNRRLWRSRLGSARWRLPIFVPLGAAAPMLSQKTEHGTDRSLLDVLPRLLPADLQRHPAAAAYFAERLDDGECVVLLDGLDEVASDEEFQTTAHTLRGFVTRYKDNQFIVTTRNTPRSASWRDGLASEFSVFYVNDLTDGQVRTFIDTWYEAVERNAVPGPIDREADAERRQRERRAKERAAELKEILRTNSSIRRLASNPMLLSILALLHRGKRRLDRERRALYQECSQLLLEQWDVQRGVRVDDTGLRLQQKEAIMRRLAKKLHAGDIGEKGGGREARREEVENVIAEMMPALKGVEDKELASTEASRLLNRLIERSGLVVERRRDVIMFSHHTFQEYFSAEFLRLAGRSIQAS